MATRFDTSPAQSGTLETISDEAGTIPTGSLVEVGVRDGGSKRIKISKPSGSTGVFGITTTKHTPTNKRGFTAKDGIWPVKVVDASIYTEGNYAGAQNASYEPEERAGGQFKIVEIDTAEDVIWLQFTSVARGNLLVRIDVRTASSTYTVKATEWDGTTSGDDITGVKCYPETDYFVVGDLAFLIEDSVGAQRVVPVSETVFAEEGG